MHQVLFEDFSNFPAGPLPTDFTAAGEYHHMPHDEGMGGWYEPMRSNQWRPHAPWMIVEDDGKHRLLQAVDEGGVHPRILTRGDVYWRDYTVSVCFMPLKTDAPVGIIVRYQTSMHGVRVECSEGHIIRIVSVDRKNETVLAEAECTYSTTSPLSLVVSVDGTRITASLDDVDVIEAQCAEPSSGKIGLYGLTTAFFDSIEVKMADGQFERYINVLDEHESVIHETREQHPKPVLWRRIDTRGFGTGRQIRFGHLTGSENLDIVIAQNLKLHSGNDSLTTIRCITALDLNGNVLWQFGEPGIDLDHGLVTCDLPFQVYDIDNDGFDEVLCLKNFKLYVLDGRTGKAKWVRALPGSPDTENEYGRLTGDAIIIANFRGRDHAADIVVKNRYRQFWAFADSGELLWTKKFPTWLSGHFAQPYDFDGDGKDELFVGYSLLDSDGSELWSHDWTDHTDEIAIGPFDPAKEDLQIALVSGDEGFNILSADGEILHREMVGHAQRLTAAKFRDDMPGLQFYVVTYWGHAGIISFHACNGTEQFHLEPEDLGSILNPVNWSGNGTELALLSGCTRTGGMIDGYGRRVVVFPDDGHPDMCAEALDLTGDSRDEVVLWDMDSMWIYTQDRPFAGKKIYAPKRYPHFNASNYRAEISIPAWHDADANSVD